MAGRDSSPLAVMTLRWQRETVSECVSGGTETRVPDGEAGRARPSGAGALRAEVVPCATGGDWDPRVGKLIHARVGSAGRSVVASRSCDRCIRRPFGVSVGANLGVIRSVPGTVPRGGDPAIQDAVATGSRPDSRPSRWPGDTKQVVDALAARGLPPASPPVAIAVWAVATRQASPGQVDWSWPATPSRAG